MRANTDLPSLRGHVPEKMQKNAGYTATHPSISVRAGQGHTRIIIIIIIVVVTKMEMVLYIILQSNKKHRSII